MKVTTLLLGLRDISAPDLAQDLGFTLLGSSQGFDIHVYPFHLNVRMTDIVSFREPNLPFREIISPFLTIDISIFALHNYHFVPVVAPLPTLAQ